VHSAPSDVQEKRFHPGPRPGVEFGEIRTEYRSQNIEFRIRRGANETTGANLSEFARLAESASIRFRHRFSFSSFRWCVEPESSSLPFSHSGESPEAEKSLDAGSSPA